MNESFSGTTRRIAEEADKALTKVERDHTRDFNSIPAQYRQTVRFIARMAYYEGRGDGAQFIVDGVKP